MSYLCHRAHKYVAKIKGAGPGGKTLYFYTQEAYQGYLRGKERRREAVEYLDDTIREREDDGIRDDLRGIASIALGTHHNPNETRSNSEVAKGWMQNAFSNAWGIKVDQIKKENIQKRYKVTRAGTNKAVSDTGTRSELPGDRLKSKSITRATKRRRKEERRRRATMELNRR